MSAMSICGASPAALAATILVAAPASGQDVAAKDIVEFARTAARDNRHADAIAGFRAAIAEQPERRAELLVELADQLTWSNQLADAVEAYRSALALIEPAQGFRAHVGLARALSWQGKHDEAISEYAAALIMEPQNREVRLLQAEVMGWAERHGAASDAYRAILNDHPDDAAAGRGLARSLSWRGYHRAALAVLQAMPEPEHQSREARVIAAETLIWMGRADRAEPLLRDALSAFPDDRHLAWLLAEILRRDRPEARIDARLFDQSDDLGIRDLSAELALPLAMGSSGVGLRLGHTRYDPPSGPVQSIEVTRPQMFGRFRLSDAVQLSGSAALDIINTRGADGDYVKPTFEAYATVWPSDIVRIDFGGSRWTFDNEASLRTGLTATQWGGSVDLVPVDHVQLSARVSRTRFSDSNRRTWWQLEAGKRLNDSPRLYIGYRYTNFDFKLTGQPGYYNPDSFSSHEALLRSWGRLGSDLRWYLRLAAGRETERPGGSRWSINAGASVTWEASDRLEVEAGYDFSTSRTTSVGGFERNIARVTLRWKL